MEHEKNTRGGWWSLLVRVFQMMSISLLSLLIPLSFLFISRLSLSSSTTSSSSIVVSFLHKADVGFIYTILSLVVASTLIHNLSWKLDCSVFRSRLYICWIIHVQGCFAFGTEGVIMRAMTTVPLTSDESMFLDFQERSCVFVKVVFFMGLHEVMLMWFRAVVKPVVDDTFYVEEETWVERAVVALTFGLMWWWRLRDEVESLVIVAEVKRNLLIRLEGIDLRTGSCITSVL